MEVNKIPESILHRCSPLKPIIKRSEGGLPSDGNESKENFIPTDKEGIKKPLQKDIFIKEKPIDPPNKTIVDEESKFNGK